MNMKKEKMGVVVKKCIDNWGLMILYEGTWASGGNWKEV